MKKLWVFDLDGTLVNSIGDIAGAINRSLIRMGKPTHPPERFYQMVGDGMELLCRRALPEANPEELSELIRLYQEDYLQNCCVETKAYPGVLKLLRSLKKAGISAAIISNKPQEQTQEVVSKILGASFFLEVIGQNPQFPKKPEPKVFLDLMARRDVKKEDVCYIGDSDVDILFGRRAGVDTIGAAWGFRGAQELKNAGAPRIVYRVSELEEDILK